MSLYKVCLGEGALSEQEVGASTPLVSPSDLVRGSLESTVRSACPVLGQRLCLVSPGACDRGAEALLGALYHL